MVEKEIDIQKYFLHLQVAKHNLRMVYLPTMLLAKHFAEDPCWLLIDE